MNRSFDFNGESDLDLEYAMSLTNPQPVVLLQTGDLVEGMYLTCLLHLVLHDDPVGPFVGASFDNWLDAVDASFCTFEGGDNREFVRLSFSRK